VPRTRAKARAGEEGQGLRHRPRPAHIQVGEEARPGPARREQPSKSEVRGQEAAGLPRAPHRAGVKVNAGAPNRPTAPADL
jgi:hypothetical protein